VFGGALGDDFAAAVAGFGADVDEVVGFGHDVGVVLDDDDGVVVSAAAAAAAAACRGT
jgi:hypothetical protein